MWECVERERVYLLSIPASNEKGRRAVITSLLLPRGAIKILKLCAPAQPRLNLDIFPRDFQEHSTTRNCIAQYVPSSACNVSSVLNPSYLAAIPSYLTCLWILTRTWPTYTRRLAPGVGCRGRTRDSKQMSLLRLSRGAATRTRTKTGATSNGLASFQSALSSPARSCLGVQYRRLSKQTQAQAYLPRRPLGFAGPRESRDAASAPGPRFLSTTPFRRSPILPEASTTPDDWKTKAGPDGPDLNLQYVEVEGVLGKWHPSFLRDACSCPLCVDPSSKQKTFQTSDIPADLEASSVKQNSNGDLAITWTKDVPGFDSNHVSTIPAALFRSHQARGALKKSRYIRSPSPWWKSKITQKFQLIDFEEYMHDDRRLLHALRNLNLYGILLVRGIPDNEHAVEDLTSRIGGVRDTFYGRTWDVKSVPNAKNVAYTQQHLGLHMDLLYMQNPPGFQFLHCLKNASPGGTSMFSDALNAAYNVNESVFNTLATQNIAFEYRNDGQHYYQERPVLEVGSHKVQIKQSDPTARRPEVKNINWSPPFQAPLPFHGKLQGYPLPKVLDALRAFGREVQNPRCVYEYKLNEGECVIFNNRRILHGRTAFDSSQGGRWLKGTYVDDDVLQSRVRVLSDQFVGLDGTEINRGAQFVHPEARMQHKEPALRLNNEEVNS